MSSVKVTPRPYTMLLSCWAITLSGCTATPQSMVPKFASNNRTTGTPEENAAVVKGSIATYGTYSVADKNFTLKIEHSTFPNWVGATQPRTITVTGDELKWSNPAGSGGGVVELVLKRVK